MTKLSNLSWAACSCQVALTPGHLLTALPANKSYGPHDQTQLLCRWSQVLGQYGTDCCPHCCLSADSKWSVKHRKFWQLSYGVLSINNCQKKQKLKASWKHHSQAHSCGPQDHLTTLLTILVQKLAHKWDWVVTLQNTPSSLTCIHAISAQHEQTDNHKPLH